MSTTEVHFPRPVILEDIVPLHDVSKKGEEETLPSVRKGIWDDVEAATKGLIAKMNA